MLKSRRFLSLLTCIGVIVGGSISSAPSASAEAPIIYDNTSSITPDSPAGSLKASPVYRVYNYSNSAGAIGIEYYTSVRSSIVPGQEVAGDRKGIGWVKKIKLGRGWCIKETYYELTAFNNVKLYGVHYHDGNEGVAGAYTNLYGGIFRMYQSNIGLYPRPSGGCEVGH